MQEIIDECTVRYGVKGVTVVAEGPGFMASCLQKVAEVGLHRCTLLPYPPLATRPGSLGASRAYGVCVCLCLCVCVSSFRPRAQPTQGQGSLHCPEDPPCKSTMSLA